MQNRWIINKGVGNRASTGFKMRHARPEEIKATHIGRSAIYDKCHHLFSMFFC